MTTTIPPEVLDAAADVAAAEANRVGNESNFGGSDPALKARTNYLRAQGYDPRLDPRLDRIVCDHCGTFVPYHERCKQELERFEQDRQYPDAPRRPLLCLGCYAWTFPYDEADVVTA